MRAFIAGEGGSVVEFILVAAILLVLFVLALSKAAEVAKRNPCDPPAPSYCRDMKEAERETLKAIEAIERWSQVKATRKALPPVESEDVP